MHEGEGMKDGEAKVGPDEIDLKSLIKPLALDSVMVNGSIEGMISGSSQHSGKAAGHTSEQRRPPSVRGYNHKILMDVSGPMGMFGSKPFSNVISKLTLGRE